MIIALSFLIPAVQHLGFDLVWWGIIDVIIIGINVTGAEREAPRYRPDHPDRRQCRKQAGIDDRALTLPEMIAYASTVIPLLPGDVIATGGAGRFRESQLFREPGMKTEIGITGVGTLTNGVADKV